MPEVTYTSSSSEVTFVSGARINATTGDILTLSSWSYIEIPVDGYDKISFKGIDTSSSILGYAFYDSSNTYVSGEATRNSGGFSVDIPNNATIFRYAMDNTSWSDTDLNKFTLMKIEKTSVYGILIKTSTINGESIFKIYRKDGENFKTESLTELDGELKEIAKTHPVSSIKAVQSLGCTFTLSTADDLGNATGATVELTRAEIDALYDEVKAKIYV